MYLIFDTETTGLPRNFKAPITDTDNWPRVVQLAWQLHDESGKLIKHNAAIIKPNGFTIPFDSEKVHGISTALANYVGRELDEVIAEFMYDLKQSNLMSM
jgi:DNA polymerase-3 subunit alpha